MSTGYCKDLTPTRRLLLAVTIPKLLRERVDVEVPGGRCLIENVSHKRGVGYARCFDPDNLSEKDLDSLLTSLEYHWNMKYLSLNLDTRYNIFRVGASLHRMFRADDWMLVPEDDIIQRFVYSLEEQKDGRSRPVRSKFPKLDGTRFKYRLVPVRTYNMELITISRQNDVDLPRQPLDISAHVYPFYSLPPFESHLHPKFAIFEAGRKLATAFETFIPSGRYHQRDADVLNAFRRASKEQLQSDWPIVVLIERIYNAWTRQPRIATIMKDPDFNPRIESNDNGSSDNKSNESARTNKTNRTGRREVKKRRLNFVPPIRPGGFQPHNQSVRSSSSRRRKCNSHDLSGRTLKNLEDHLGRKPWTKEAILSWSSNSVTGGGSVPVT